MLGRMTLGEGTAEALGQERMKTTGTHHWAQGWAQKIRQGYQL